MKASGSKFPPMKGQRCLVCALVSAKQKNPEQLLVTMEAAVKAAGGIPVARLLQRKGVSRGGVAGMKLPLTQRCLFGTGKLKELLAQVEVDQIGVLLVYNALTLGQRKSLAEVAGCRVYSFLDCFGGEG